MSPQYRRVSVAIYTTVSLVAFEGTSVAAALPELTADLGRIDLLPWVITAYLFAAGVTTIVAGPLVDALGVRRMFVGSAIVFSLTGFSAGLANDIWMMIGIRLVQGGASGVLFASTIAAVNLAYPSSLTGRAFAANSTIWGLLGAAAPALAALLLEIASWRWIFFVNLPLGAIALLAGRTTLPERQEGAEAPSIDWRGAGLAAVFTLSTIAAVDQLGPRSAALAAVAVAAVAAYVAHARRVERPVLRLDHIAGQPYRTIGLVPALMIGGAFASNLYITIYVAAGRGWSTTTAAWSVLFLTIGWTTGANTSSRLLDRSTEIAVMTVGLGTGITGSVVLAGTAIVEGPLAGVFAGLAGMGLGIGLSTNAALTLLRRVTKPQLIGRAGAAHQFLRGQGFTLGSAAGGAVLLFVVGRELGTVEPVQRLLAGDEVAAGSSVAEAVRNGFAVVSVLSMATTAAALAPLLSLRRYTNSAASADRLPAAVRE